MGRVLGMVTEIRPVWTEAGDQRPEIRRDHRSRLWGRNTNLGLDYKTFEKPGPVLSQGCVCMKCVCVWGGVPGLHHLMKSGPWLVLGVEYCARGSGGEEFRSTQKFRSTKRSAPSILAWELLLSGYWVGPEG